MGKLTQILGSLIVLCQLLKLSEEAIRFSKEPDNPSYVKKGNKATLVWDYTVTDRQAELKGIIWGVNINNQYKTLIIESKNGSRNVWPDIPPTYSGRVGIEGKASLVIENVTNQDNTFFQCELKAEPSSGFPNQLSPIKLIVREVPEIIPISISDSYNRGSSVTISCTAKGIPEPDVEWKRNGKVRANGKKTASLTFSSINKTDGGNYTCTASNSEGSTEYQVTLVVNYKPEGSTLTTSAAANTVTQGDSVTFTCQVTAAVPQVSQYLFFFKNDTTPVKDSNDSQYTISNVQRSQHYGEYKCVPHNNVGDGPKATVTLNVNVPVQFTVLPQNVTVNETNPIDVICAASGFPAPSISWKKYVQSTAELKDPNTQSSNRSDAGMYVCTATNGMGQDKTAEVYVTVQYPPTIKEATTSPNKSWIGQTVTLKCVSDGVPTPTLTWYKPDGSQVRSVTAAQNKVGVKMEGEKDFGGYKCDADNGLTPADFKIVKIEQIKKPGAPTVIIGQSDIQATSLKLKWTAPADDGGSPITAYRVVILKGGTEIKNENVTDPGTASLSIGSLERDTNYTVKVFARNAVFEGPAGEKQVKTKYEGVPAAATIDDLPSEVTDDTITLKWSEPQNNGKVIIQYTVYQRVLTNGKPGEWTKIKTITDTSVREWKVELQKGKVYEFVVTATNELGESLKEDGKIKRVKASGVPAAVEMGDIPSEVTDSTVTLKWKKPQSYGSDITQYTVYQRIVTDGEREWTKLKTIKDTSVREWKVELEKGKEYEFVVTATNDHGESEIEESKIQRVKVKGGEPGGGGSRTDDKDNGMGTAIYAGAAAAGVLLIIGIVVIIVLWRRRKSSSHDETSVDALGSVNPYEIEDGYQSVSREAAQSLQASGPVAEPNYAQVDPSKKKKNRRPPPDEYAQVDKSKKTKKTPKKKPGELEYADLDDLRSDFQLAPVPGGAAAGPVVRPPAYEGTEYADIAQFGVPPPEPTYANVSKKDVVYSNVESM